ncbi:hypothetical protein SAMN04488498_101414 [Mesorhizobium albiziae]|uniref:Uncharacterized protein n=1 Tax=Neomesorhizobium albiziae TaxID=335020 RepID=A0A1I3VEW7_9HYPH|nr:hypothetical protein [Mesorhizobium albiziae]GLS28873.1 hypothetical protein GCM10007937_05800 [Mesorhizobium albiziae]SFJ93918.1 hypothetical protein SAMN04488498_101414 [Mesorhizobium albiziae]
MTITKADEQYRLTTRFMTAEELPTYRQALDKLGLPFELEIKSDVERRKANGGDGHSTRARRTDETRQWVLSSLRQQNVATAEDLSKSRRAEGFEVSEPVINRHLTELALDGYVRRERPTRSGNTPLWAITALGRNAVEPGSEDGDLLSDGGTNE